MRRIMMTVLAGVLLSAGATWAWATHSGEAFPPECSNSDGGTNILDTTKTSYTADGLTVDLKLAGPSCLAADYSVVVFDEPYTPGTTAPVVIDSITFPGDGSSSSFTINRPVDDDDTGIPRICVNVTASTTQHVDTATNTSTAPSGGGSAPSMQDSDSNSVDTETIVDWGSNNATGGWAPCITVTFPSPGSGGQGYG